MWRKYPGRVEGLLLGGDKNVPPTTRWNHLWLRFRVWKTVTVIRIPDEVKAYRIGYIPAFGEPMYNTTVFKDLRFAVRHGYEDCRFFAVDLEGTELPLTVLRRTTITLLERGIKLV